MSCLLGWEELGHCHYFQKFPVHLHLAQGSSEATTYVNLLYVKETTQTLLEKNIFLKKAIEVILVILLRSKTGMRSLQSFKYHLPLLVGFHF